MGENAVNLKEDVAELFAKNVARIRYEDIPKESGIIPELKPSIAS